MKTLSNRLVVALFLFLIYGTTYGQELITTSKYELVDLTAYQLVTVYDPLYAEEQLQPSAFKADRRFRVQLNYNRIHKTDFENSLNWRLTVTLQNTVTMEVKSLVIVKDQNIVNTETIYGAWADFVGDSEQMEWEVKAITPEKYTTSWVSATMGELPTEDIHLECMVFNDRIVALDESACPKLSLIGSELNWQYVSGAKEYDVEWVFIDGLDNFIYNSSEPDGPFEFKEPVRITTYKHSHELDLIYPTGTLYFRIRPKGFYFSSTHDKEVYYAGTWCYDKKTGSGNMLLDITSDYEGDKNWSYSVAFAENGMSKSSVSYYDGSLRARQQLTRLKSSGVVVAAGSVYDYEGRQAVQIIPTPVSGGSLNYFSDLHAGFDKSDFDEGTSNAMSTTSGAGKYYSSSNSFTSEEPFRDRIPDAAGYTYSQTKFINDNTGRPRVAAGPGATHRMGAGHESYFYYVKPTERNLRELFGSNVGEVTHYDKQISVDQNGQAFVQYTDQLGRVIASGLFAGNPENLLPLDNNTNGVAVEQVASLMPNNIISVDANGNLQSITDYFHMNIGSNTIELDYNLLSGSINSEGTVFGSSCASCFYELEVHVFDPSGAEVDLNYTSVTASGTFPYIFERYSEGTLDCNSATFTPALGNIHEDLSISLSGEYRILKILRVDTDAVNSYVANNLATLQTAPTLSTMISDAVANAITIGCGFDCEAYYEQECREELSISLTTPQASLTSQELSDLLECIQTKCDAVDSEIAYDQENDGNTCNMLLEMLKADVTPGGWVFESDNAWRSYSPNWDFNYTGSGGTFNPTDLADLEANWESGWEDDLVSSHPEYCHYQKCLDLEDINDELAEYYATISMSSALGTYLDNTTKDLLPNGDPLFTSSVYSSITPDPTDWLISLNDDYLGSNMNLYDYVTTDLIVYNTQLTADGSGTQLTGTELQDRIWMIIRGMYLGERLKYMETYYLGCDYHDHIDANFKDPLLLESQPPPYLVPVNADCPDICSQNVQFWMQSVLDECPELSEANQNAVATNLMNYCLSSCDGVFNATGSILLSDLLSSPIDTYLGNVNTILAGVACEFDLGSIAITDTCSNSTTQTVNYLYGFTFAMQQKMAALLSVKNDNYNQFIVSPAITLVTNYTIEFPSSYWSSGMQLKLTNTLVPTSTTYDIEYIESISIANWDVNLTTGAILFTFKVVKTSGVIEFVDANQFALSKYRGGWETFDINTVDKDFSTTTEVCDDPINPFSFDVSWETYEEDCIDAIENEAAIIATQNYLQQMGILESNLLQTFSANCFGSGLSERFSITYPRHEYAFTLYYYDQAGSLVQTVPPQGCHIVPTGGFDVNGEWDQVTEPAHLMKTMYTYNSLGQITKSQTPDGGTGLYYYNSAQQMRFSQNDYQNTLDHYSYTRYDELGRPIEAGVTEVTSFMAYFTAVKDDNAYPAASAMYPNLEVMRSFYEEQSLDLDSRLGWTPKDLNTRIAAVAYYEEFDGDQDAYSHATFYDYDIHGNVQTLLQDNPAMGEDQRYKNMRYSYDLYSGKMNEVVYQENEQDQFIHRYAYDDDNRLLHVETSRDGVSWDKDAAYFYYLTGALARVELGDDKVQGMDYAYNLNGWLKGVNSNTLEARRDMGHDGAAINSGNKWVAQDAFGFSLSYYENDYTPIVAQTVQDNKWFATDEYSSFMPATGENLYNGNIRAMVTAISDLNNSTVEVLAKVYQYDQLQRIKEAKTYKTTNLVANNSWTGGSFTDAYYSSYEFDLNGNLTELTRNGSGGENALGEFVMDDFTYYYSDGIGGMTTDPQKLNRLMSVVDNIQHSGSPTTGQESYDEDIDNTQSASTANYIYDEIGRLVQDVDEEIDEIVWTTTNKVSYIRRDLGSMLPDVGFQYDAMGMRVAKTTYKKITGGYIDPSQTISTFYVYDASGNVMATYEQLGEAPEFTTLQDHSIYGSSRVGVQNHNEVLSSTPASDFCSKDNRASAIIKINSGTFTSGQTVQYKVGTQILNSAITWGATLESNVANLLNAVNDLTPETAVEASVWYSHNASGDYFLEFKYTQPGNWLGQQLDLYVNSSSVSIAGHIERTLGYGSCEGQDIIGTKTYELSNHLGNVLAVITDRKWAVDAGTFNSTTGALISGTLDGNADYYRAEVISYSDYYPYGMLLPGRHDQESADSYRYGFQGQEMDDEVKGKGNSYGFEARIFDSRVGRWLSLDPLAAKYPNMSPYNFVGNIPIIAIDPNGKEIIVVVASDEHDNSFKFINAGLREIIKMSRKDYASTQNRTLMLVNVNNFYSKKAIDRIRKRTEKYGAELKIITKSSELVDYMNGESESIHGECRDHDLITALKFFAHGTIGKIHMNYKESGNWTINKEFVDKVNADGEINGEVFSNGACVTSYACRTGAGVDISAGPGQIDQANPIGVPTGSLRNDYEYQYSTNQTWNSLAQAMANGWDVKVYALLERSFYQSLYSAGWGAWLQGEEAQNESLNEWAAPEIIDGKTLTKEGAVKDVRAGQDMVTVSRKWWVFKKNTKAKPVD